MKEPPRPQAGAAFYFLLTENTGYQQISLSGVKLLQTKIAAC
jgi:hypothetical protein